MGNSDSAAFVGGGVALLDWHSFFLMGKISIITIIIKKKRCPKSSRCSSAGLEGHIIFFLYIKKNPFSNIYSGLKKGSNSQEGPEDVQISSFLTPHSWETDVCQKQDLLPS